MPTARSTRQELSATTITLGELVRVEPLASAATQALLDPGKRVEQVVLAADFDRLRHCTPHSLVVLHGEAATGGWSLAAALHIAWERNVPAVVVSRSLVTPAGYALAERLATSILAIDGDPVDTALELARQVGAPAATRALRQARLAERLASENGLRDILGLLNTELPTTPVALVSGDSVLAGRGSAIQGNPDSQRIRVEIPGPGNRPWAHLVAAIPRTAFADIPQLEAMLHLARPSLQAAWAQARLDSATQVAQEQAAFALLRRMVSEARPETTATNAVEPPAWTGELGWHVQGLNRAIWLAPHDPATKCSDELTHLVRGAWRHAKSDWPLIPEHEGWISWQNDADPEDLAPLRRVLHRFHDSATAHELVIGVGRASSGVQGLMKSAAEARLAAHVARRDTAGSVSWFHEVGSSAALAWLPTTEIAQVAELCLPELMSARDREALVQTVLAVLDCGGSLSHASDRLGVHRNTVLARVARARKLGLTFDEPTHRLALHLICYCLAARWRLSAQIAE